MKRKALICILLLTSLTPLTAWNNRQIDNVINQFKNSSLSKQTEKKLQQMGVQAFPQLVTNLGNSNKYVRRNVLLLFFDPPFKQFLLEKKLDRILDNLRTDSDWVVRNTVVLLLGTLQNNRVTPILLRYLKDEEITIRKNSAEALSKIGSPALPSLVKSLRDPDSKVRVAVSEAIKIIAKKNSLGSYINPIMKALKDSSWEVRKNITIALGSSKSRLAYKPLLVLINDPNLKVKNESILALGKIGNKRVYSYFQSRIKQRDILNSIVVAFGYLKDKRAVPTLIKLLKDRDLNIQDAVAESLGQIKDRRAVMPLINKLRTSKYYKEKPGYESSMKWVSRSSAIALGEIGDKRAIPELIVALGSKYWEVRRLTVEALAKFKGRKVFNALKKALKDEDEFVRVNAVLGFGKLGDSKAVSILIKALKDSSDSIRKSAAISLGVFKNKRGVRALIEALKDSDWYVGEEAARSLGNIGDKSANSALNALKYDRYIGKVVTLALIKIKYGKDIIQKLIKDLKNQDWMVRENAVKLLAEFKNNDKVLYVLIRMLNDSSIAVRSTTAEALDKMGDKRAIPSLDKVANNDSDDYVRKVALKALNSLIKK